MSHDGGGAPERNREHRIEHQLSALNLGFIEHLMRQLELTEDSQCSHESVQVVGRWLTQVIRDNFNYHAVPGKLIRISNFRSSAFRLWRQPQYVAASKIGFNGHTTEALLTSTYRSPEMHIRTLRTVPRHIHKVVAVCGSSARTDLCGGRQVTAAPTATILFPATQYINVDLPS